MIRKRQIRFVISSMSLLFVVLAVIWGVLSVSSYYNVVKDADSVLEILSENKGKFPLDGGKPGNGLPPNMSPEIPYEFFSSIKC